ncbi:MAG: DUF4250 domain-containing protein [Bacteroidales bacterium]|nr:DUF4250 domain-containing protein [Candidatus Cryptobacteroides equifaecalis]
MDHLPLSDTAMLVSAINRLLRDGEFEDLDDICSYYEIPRGELEEKLGSQGFQYDEALNSVR